MKQDDAVAVRWYRKAADQGNAGAQSHLGFMYMSGRGVAQDDAAAARWWRMAADQGESSAQLNLGALYATGKGVAEDMVEALKWFELAVWTAGSDEERARAEQSRDQTVSLMTPDQIAQAQARVKSWRPVS